MCTIRTVKKPSLLLLSCIQYSGCNTSLSDSPPRDMDLDSLDPTLPFCQVGSCQRFPAQYARACTRASVPPPKSSPRVSAAVLTHRFNHHLHFVVPIILYLFRISTHICRVSSHGRPLRLCSSRSIISFVPIIYSLTIARTFRFAGVGNPSPVSAISFLLHSICTNSLLLLFEEIDSRCFLLCDRVSVLPGWDTIPDLP